MADIRLHGRPVHTVFDLLGEKEDDIPCSVGWGLAQSDSLAYALLGEIFHGEVGDLTAVLLQQTEVGTGRTDIEVQTRDAHLIVEAKRGWELPSDEQLGKYARRLAAGDERRRAIAVIAECATHYPPVADLPGELEGVPILYIPWSRVATLVASVVSESRNHAEKRLLAELDRYLRRLMTSQDITSNLVYVVSLNHHDLRWSELSFVQTVMERERYYHPVGGPGRKWPKTPANYLGFRFDGQLQRVSFVEDYEVITRPHDHIAEVSPDADWSDEPHFLYRLGPHLPLPDHPVKSTGMWNREPRWVSRRPRSQVLSWQRARLRECLHRGSIPTSCESAPCGWCSSRAVRSPTSRLISASTRSRFGIGSARPRLTPGRARIC